MEIDTIFHTHLLHFYLFHKVFMAGEIYCQSLVYFFLNNRTLLPHYRPIVTGMINLTLYPKCISLQQNLFYI